MSISCIMDGFIRSICRGPWGFLGTNEDRRWSEEVLSGGGMAWTKALSGRVSNCVFLGHSMCEGK